MFCPYCGSQNENGTAFCQFCGIDLSAASSTSATPDSPVAPVNTVDTPSYTPPTTQVNPATSKPSKSIDAKKLMLDILFYFLLAAAYCGLSVIMLTTFSNADAISANSIFDPDISNSMSLQDFCSVLINGNTFFNPTGISTALAVGMYILVYGTAPVAAVAFLSSVICKRKGFPMHVLSVIFSVISAAFLAVIVPVSVKLVPNVKAGLSAKLVMLKDDVGNFDYKLLIIFSALMLVMTALTIIFTSVATKRREAK